MASKQPADEVNPSLPDPEETGREYEKKGTVWVIQMQDPFDVTTLEGPVTGKAGDFLCKGAEDEMWPIDAEIFMKTYQPVSPPLENVFKKSA
jgi:hypothetical protein